MKAARTACRRLSALLAAWVAAASVTPVSACGYDAGPLGGLSVAHPSSLPVAMAIASAVAAGRLQPLPDAPPQLALLRATFALRSATAMLDPSAAGLPPVAVVLVEAHLWSRTTSGPGGPQFAAHVAGPGDGDVVLVTGEMALRALLAGQLSWDAALASGLVVVDGPAEPRERLTRRLAQRFS